MKAVANTNKTQNPPNDSRARKTVSSKDCTASDWSESSAARFEDRRPEAKKTRQLQSRLSDSPQSLHIASVQRIVDTAPPAVAQRKIVVGGTKQNVHTLSTGLLPLLTDKSKRYLQPIYEEWMKSKAEYPSEPAANFQALRTALIAELVDGWRTELKRDLPVLFTFLPERQFNTLIFMTNLQNGFSAVELEKALKTAKSAKNINQDHISEAFSPGKLPLNDVGNGIFAVDWSAQVPGVTGLTAELQTAVGINPKEVMGGQKISLSQDMDLGGRTMGGQTTQDADVSFVSVSGENVLVEVAASVARMRDKMGANGQMQRARYARLVQLNADRVLAYSTPSASWIEFFSGDEGNSIAELLPALDGGWGLIIDGHYASPDELTTSATTIRGAEPKVPGFWEALNASHFTYAEATGKSSDELQSSLQRFARRR